MYHYPAGLVDVSHQGVETVHGHKFKETSIQVAFSFSPQGDGGLGLGKAPGQGSDGIGIQPRDGGHVPGGILLHDQPSETQIVLSIRDPVLESKALAIHKVPVIKSFLDNHMGQPQGQGSLRARCHGNPLVRLGGGIGGPGFDLDNFDFALHGRLMPETPCMNHASRSPPSFNKPATETEDKVAVFKIIGHGAFSPLHEPGHYGGGVFNTGHPGVVRAPQCLHKPLNQQGHG